MSFIKLTNPKTHEEFSVDTKQVVAVHGNLRGYGPAVDLGQGQLLFCKESIDEVHRLLDEASNKPQEVSELKGLDGLIAALKIFRKYGNPISPTHCEHDALYVCVDPKQVTAEDVKRLEKLHFLTSEDPDFEGCFVSFYFGSA